MKAIDFLGAEVEGKVIAVTCKYASDKIFFQGSNLKTSVNPGSKVQLFSIIAPEKGKQGIVIVTITRKEGTGKNSTSLSQDFILPVYHPVDENKKPYIDLESKSIWVPPFPDRLPQIEDSYYQYELNHIFTVKIGGIIYTTDKYTAEKNPKVRYVPDGNLLCRYITGEVDAIGVRQRAAEYAQEISTKKKMNILVIENAELHKKVDKLDNQVETLKKELDEWEEKAKNLKEAADDVWLQWCIPTSIRAAINALSAK